MKTTASVKTRLLTGIATNASGIHAVTLRILLRREKQEDVVIDRPTLLIERNLAFPAAIIRAHCDNGRRL